ncbi:hypothetical protein GCM10023093_18490 [Nemorincola caseinilytica]|uniref:DUF6438 domain-containing protein n=1 Tax=Nemorincola caseinilytica TaxID=2054315 RepID=A0ABP8NI04_9BACT
MKKLTLLILMLAAVAGVHAKTVKKKKKQATSKEIVSVSIHRTVCFGKCPDYIVEINKDGTATYTGRMFVQDTGIFKKNIGKQKAGEIITLFKTYRVDTCSEMYENRIPDLPGLNMVINYKKGKKQIYNCKWGPAFLEEIATAMEEAGKMPDESKTGWKKTGMPKKP